jgi:hypothetical protein
MTHTGTLGSSNLKVLYRPPRSRFGNSYDTAGGARLAVCLVSVKRSIAYLWATDCMPQVTDLLISLQNQARSLVPDSL